MFTVVSHSSLGGTQGFAGYKLDEICSYRVSFTECLSDNSLFSFAEDCSNISIAMTREEFESVVEKTFEMLPEPFAGALDNVAIVVEQYPDEETVRKMKLRSKHNLLGLYQGVPLTARGTWYGMTPSSPDKISLYQENIEGVCRSDEEVRRKIYEVLIHEIGHYFGMNEEQIRSAGY